MGSNKLLLDVFFSVLFIILLVFLASMTIVGIITFFSGGGCG